MSICKSKNKNKTEKTRRDTPPRFLRININLLKNDKKHLTTTQKLAGFLKILVVTTFICNLTILPFVPGIVGMGSEYGLWGAAEKLEVLGTESGPLVFLAVCWQYLFRVWRSQYTAVLTLFLVVCGICTAVILWQAKGVLDTVLEGEPFRKRIVSA